MNILEYCNNNKKKKHVIKVKNITCQYEKIYIGAFNVIVFKIAMIIISYINDNVY